jgi:hypothetical protein
MRTLAIWCLCACACLRTETASSHHSGPQLDYTKILKLDGVVTGVRWVNPHVGFWVKVAESGAEESWLIEAPSRNTLLKSGWRQPVAGDKVVFFVHPQLDSNARYDSGDRPGVYVGAILSDGTRFGSTSGMPNAE